MKSKHHSNQFFDSSIMTALPARGKHLHMLKSCACNKIFCKSFKILKRFMRKFLSSTGAKMRWFDMSYMYAISTISICFTCISDRSGQSFYCTFLDIINVKCSRKYQCHLKKKSLVWNSSHFLLRWRNAAGVVDFIVEGSRASYFRWSKTLFIGFVWNIKETFSWRLDLCEFVKWKKTSLAFNNETILLYFILKLMITGVRRKGGGGGWRGEKWALFEVYLSSIFLDSSRSSSYYHFL